MNIINMEKKNYLRMYCNMKELLKTSKHIIFSVVLILYVVPSFSQEPRLADNNSIGWFAYTGTLKVNPKTAIHTEYQWRRVDGIKNWQQGLFRTGINYALRKDVSLNAGYAFAQTFPYGDYPGIASFPEHRIYEQVVLKNPMGKIDLSHRFTLEQRFLRMASMQNGQIITDWRFLNRMRYRLRAEIPIDKKAWSIAFQDEVFIGWGKNIGANVFDQNRLAVLLGYKLNQTIKFEAGYLNQILQQGRRVNDKAVFQYNHGFLITVNFSFSLLK